MALNINQFSQSTVQGSVDLLGFGSNVISGAVDNAQVTAIVPGQPVKLATTTGGVPKFVSLAANTDQAFGFAVYNLKDISYAANARLEVALFGTVMYMTSGAAITRGASLEVVYTASTVITNAGTNPVIGFALDGASASGQLIRVYIQAPFSSIQSNLTQRSQIATVTATLAQINAGLVLIPGITGQKITVSSYTARVTGAFATGTAVILESNNGTPVLVTTLAEAGLTNGAVLLPSSANTTLGAGFATPLGTSDGLQVVNSGSAQTGGTSIQFTITFTQA